MPSIQKVIKDCPCQPPRCHLEKVRVLHQQLLSGIPYPHLGGKRIRQNREIIRFKIGRNWRLLYLRKAEGIEPYCLITRQKFEQILMRR